jgi:flavin reductase (DIM6/NTAB) family NADH-FMN oxidoreductase RutF
MVKETDYCGLVSGKNTVKSTLFDSFYGQLKTAPMIKNCPINMECRLVQTVDFPNHDVFVGEIVETYCDDQVMTDNIVDLAKVRPILFAMNNRGYWELGKPFARAWEIGKDFKKG